MSYFLESIIINELLFRYENESRWRVTIIKNNFPNPDIIMYSLNILIRSIREIKKFCIVSLRGIVVG